MGKLSIIATPIGNLEDITIRAIKTLFSVDTILCEDTRRTGQLITYLIERYGEQFDLSAQVKPPLFPYYDQIEEKMLPEILEKLQSGQHVALVSDAGTPLISDPGFRLVRECAKRKIPVESIPGPSAVITALTNSGLSTDKFLFLGYPPEKHSHRLRFFSDLKKINAPLHLTYIYYCAPHKLLQTLTDMEDALGNLEIVIERELTKIHEEVWRGTLTQARAKFSSVQGEIVVLFNIPQV